MQSAPSLRRIGSLAVLAAFSGIFLTPSCKSDGSESEAQSGATNWLRCSEDLDCSRVPGASCAADGYCVDEQGERIEGDDLEDDDGEDDDLEDDDGEDDDGEDDDGEDDDGSPVADDATALEPSPDEEPSASEGEALGPVPEPQPGPGSEPAVEPQSSAETAPGGTSGSGGLGGATGQGGAAVGGSGQGGTAAAGGVGGAATDAGSAGASNGGEGGATSVVGEECGNIQCDVGMICCDHCVGQCVDALSGAACPDDTDRDRSCDEAPCGAYPVCIDGGGADVSCTQCLSIEVCPELLCTPTFQDACAAFCPAPNLCRFTTPPQPPQALVCDPPVPCETQDECAGLGLCAYDCPGGCGDAVCLDGFCRASCPQSAKVLNTD